MSIDLEQTAKDKALNQFRYAVMQGKANADLDEYERRCIEEGVTFAELHDAYAEAKGWKDVSNS